jgi:hypothetical protein
MRIGAFRGRAAAVLLTALMCAGCADVYEAHRTTDVYTADQYNQPKPMASVDEAVRTFNDLKTFYSSGGGFHIQQLMADRTGVRFHESRTVTEQRAEDTVIHDGGLFGVDDSATTYKNVDVNQEHDAWIPADKIAGIFTNAGGIGIVYSDLSFSGLQASDHAVALKLSDAFATLQAANYGSASKYIPDQGVHYRVLPNTEFYEGGMALEYQRLGWASETGVLIDGVDPGSPGAAAGLATDDILIEANGKPVTFEYGTFAARSFANIIMDELSGKTSASFDLRVFRGGHIVPLRLTLTNPIISHAAALSDAPKPVVRVLPPVAAKPSFGVSARDLTAAEAKKAGASGGVYIGSVAEGSPAANLGLQQGDCLTEINGTKLSGLEAMKSLLAASAATSAVVWRGGKTVVLGSLSNL